MKLTPKDKNVVSSFLNRKDEYYGSRKVFTDGKELIAYPLAPLAIAVWERDYIRLQDTSKSEEVIVRYLTKAAHQRGFRVFDAFGKEKKPKAISLTPKDKKVIESFIAKKPARSRKLSTDGHSLECLLTNVVLFYHDESGYYYIIRNWKSDKLNRIHLFWTTVSKMVVKNARHYAVISYQEYEKLKKESMDTLEARLIEFNELRGRDKKPSQQHLLQTWESGLIDEEIRRVEEAISDYIHYMTDSEFQD